MANDRVTQGGGYVGRQATADVRLTVGGGYVGVTPAPDVRVTQAAGYVGRVGVLETRVTQLCGYVGARFLIPECGTTKAQCWRIERTDGVIFTFTAHDRALTFRGEVYDPCESLRASALQTSSEFGQTENLDLAGIIGDQITQGDLWAGMFDGAEVEVWEVDWSDTTRAELLAAGNCGSLEFGTTRFQFEVTTASERLQQRPILKPVMPTCRFKFGDSRCGIDLEALRVTGSVTHISDPNIHTGAVRRIFRDATRTEADNYFRLGRLTWTSGANNGQSMDVIAYASDTFTLEQPLQFDIAVGDDYSVVPGCDLLHSTCVNQWSNGVNFGGFPHLRGTDDLQKTPKAKV